MKKGIIILKSAVWIFAAAFILAGCSGSRGAEEKISAENVAEETEASEKEKSGKPEADRVSDEPAPEMPAQDEAAEPEITEADGWSEYFDGLHGTAAVYDDADRRYIMYQKDLAWNRRSPCSTFKIISSLTALEHGIIKPEDSVRTWSGEIFWNEEWNKDLDFREAFRTSCVWYYRQVIDDIGKDRMQKELDQLQYGNCDISDWEGRQNTNNQNRALTGFWIESSLQISPKEQVEVMERIFGEDSDYSKETLDELKRVMLVSQQEKNGLSIYGKTGTGKTDGITVDAWFTGFAESAEGNLYFCVHLGRTDGRDVNSSLAKEIAVQIVSDYYDSQVGNAAVSGPRP